MFLAKTDRGSVLYEKGWKITKTATCVFERGYVHMKGKSECFCLKLIGVPYEKGWKAAKKRNLCL